jgi:arginine decarboxylase-like protein
MTNSNDWIWDNGYIIRVIESNETIEEMINQVEIDNQDIFDEWKTEYEEDTYEGMINLTRDQVETLW